MTKGTAINNKAPVLNPDSGKWLQAFRGITRSTDEHTLITAHVPRSAVGHSAPLVNYEHGKAIASAIILANLNSLPLDWAARLSVGGVNMSFFIVKQLPVLPPDVYVEKPHPHSVTYAELIVPRTLELTYTAHDLEGFARDLGYYGPPFSWDEHRRHILQCELDAIFAHLYHLDRSDLEWILDPSPPSVSFPTLKRKELAQHGEYRTQRYVLQAFDQIQSGVIPSLAVHDQE